MGNAGQVSRLLPTVDPFVEALWVESRPRRQRLGGPPTDRRAVALSVAISGTIIAPLWRRGGS